MKDFKEVVKCDVEGAEEGVLRLWRNKDVDTSALAEMVSSGRWDGLEDLEGFFAGVYEQDGKAYLFCDRLGIYPVYYFTGKDGIYVSPSVSELLNAVKLSLTACREGIASFLLFTHYLADETVFEGVKRCNGGETIVIDLKGGIEDRIRWKKKHVYQDQSSTGPDEFGEMFVKGVEKSLSADDGVLISLSGGFDSRAILGAALECVKADRIITTTFGGADTFDYRIGKIVADRAGVKNMAFSFADEIFDDDFLRRRAGDYGYVYSAFSTQPQEMLDYLSGKMSEGNVSMWGAGGDAITGSHLHDSDMYLEKCGSFEDMSRLLLQKRPFIPLSIVSKLMGLDENEIVQIIADLLERSVVGEYEKTWQFLDAWDIFVRGRMELASVLPFTEELWSCPHLNRDFFNLMSIQCFDEKVHQNIYKRMLASRFKFLF
ncbi:MAG: asparagine synthase-related protein, partial [Planctomycetota bacterium]